MKSSIIKTKLYLPRPEKNFIERPSLIEKIENGIDKKLTMLVAPAGFGKTSLLASWMSHTKPRVAWLSLDSSDSDMRRFIVYVLAAVKAHVPSLEELYEMIWTANSLPTLDYIIAEFINNVADMQDDLFLVLDDYHLIQNSVIDQGMDILIRHMPGNLHLIISTREEPSISLGKFRVQNHMNELNIDDLRFSHDEIIAFFEKVNISLSEESILSIEEKTEGWAVGLKLSELTLCQSKDIEATVADMDGKQKYVIDYLMDEVLEAQPEKIRMFLMQTSILRQMSGELCDYILDDSTYNSSEILNWLRKMSLFTISLDEKGIWYRYHHLFADMLSHYLRQKTPAREDKIKTLHLKASQWYENKNNDVEAFYHASSSGDIGRTLELIENIKSKYYSMNLISILLNWINSLSDKTLNENPIIYIWKVSQQFLLGQIEGVLPLMDKAESYFNYKDHPDQMGRIATARATYALVQEDIVSIEKYAHIALDTLDGQNIAYRIFSIWTLGYALEAKGNNKEAELHYQKILGYIIGRYDPFYKALAYIRLGSVYEKMGSPDRSELLYKDVLKENVSSGRPFNFICQAHRGLSRIYRERNDFEKAYFHGEQATIVAKKYDHDLDNLILCEVQVAKVLISLGKTTEAIKKLETLDKMAKAERYEYKSHAIVNELISAYKISGNKEMVEILTHKNRRDKVKIPGSEVYLTSREIEILRLIEKGYTNKEIGTHLYLALDTVKGHNRRIFSKLQVKRRTEAVAKARKLKLFKT